MSQGSRAGARSGLPGQWEDYAPLSHRPVMRAWKRPHPQSSATTPTYDLANTVPPRRRHSAELSSYWRPSRSGVAEFFPGQGLQQILDLANDHAYRRATRKDGKTLLQPWTRKTICINTHRQRCHDRPKRKRHRNGPIHSSRYHNGYNPSSRNKCDHSQ